MIKSVKGNLVLLVSERSGSNLLRTLLGKHREISAPVPPQLVEIFYPKRKYYGDLANPVHARMLFDDMLRIVNHPYTDWKLNAHLNDEELPTSILDAVHSIYKLKAQSENKSFFCLKEIHSFKYIDAYRAEFDHAHYVHMVRDPRDHVASWLAKPHKLLTVYDIIMKWVDEQATFIDAVHSRGFECTSILYEDLIENSSDKVSEILQSAGFESDENCFETNTHNSESQRNPYWENLSKPILKDNKKKYLNVLSKLDIDIIESIARKEMEFFGYEFHGTSQWRPNREFFRENSLERESKKLALTKDNRAVPELLQSKYNLMEQINVKRSQTWLSDTFDFSEPKPVSENKKEISQPKIGFWYSRIRFFSFFLLGQRLSAKFGIK